MTVISRKTKRRDHSGIALGGIGAGKVEFCPSGRFSNLMTQNNWDAPVATVLPESRPTYDLEGIPGAFLAAWVEGAGAVVLKEKCREPMKPLKPGDIRFEGRFPRATVSYPKMSGVELSVEAFSPLVFGSDGKDGYKDSSLPGGLIVFKLKNTTRRSKKAAVLMSWHNLVGLGGFVDGLVTDRRKPSCTPLKKGGIEGLRFGSAMAKLNPRVDGHYVLATERAKGRAVQTYGYDQTNSRKPENAISLWEHFNRDGSLPGESDLPTFFWTNRAAGAVAVRLSLRPGQSVEVPFALAWWFPHLIANSNPKVDYGHAYERWFDDASGVAAYLLRERRRLYAQTREWQQALEGSNLPAWLVEKLANDLFPLFGNSWYTKDGRHTINESPTEMGGCHGTIDQRAAASAAEDMAFPGLSKSELMLFASQQVGENHPDRIGRHWDMKRGKFGRRLDRLGGIRHDTGWDDVEGGGFGSAIWQNLHWPDLTSVFVLEILRNVAWTGDRAFLRKMWPRVKRALDFQMRLDQNGDGVADLWGHGSNTYDSQDLHYYGASAFIVSLFLAANLAAEEMSKLMGDEAFAKVSRARFEKARKVYDRTLWNESRGHFNSWVDTNHAAWKGTDREHPLRSDSSMIAQLAGQWFSNHLGLPDIADRSRIAKALATIYKMNVKPVKYCPAIDMNHDGKHNYSWIQYTETYYAANAIHEGRADEGLEAVRRIWLAQYTRDGSPWDSTLRYWGEGNGDAGWGRWYMTNPASWFLLPAIAGAGVNHLRGILTLSPNIPKAIGGGKSLEAVPVFFPKFHATVDATISKKSRRIRLTITKLVAGKPLAFKRLRVLDTGIIPQVRLNGKPVTVTGISRAGRFLELRVAIRLAKAGDRLEVKS